MMDFIFSTPHTPSPSFPARGRVRFGDHDEFLPYAQYGTFPLAGEVGRGGFKLLLGS